MYRPPFIAWLAAQRLFFQRYHAAAAIIDFANADETAQRVAGHDPRPGEQPFRQRLHG